MADFPASIFVPRTTANLPGVVYDAAKTTELFAQDYSLPAAEVAAIEATLGINPQGAYDTVADRLDGIGAGLFVDNELLGTGNDVTLVFALAATPIAGSVHVYVDGRRQTLTTDYAVAGTSVTFVTAPPTGAKIVVDYRV